MSENLSARPRHAYLAGPMRSKPQYNYPAFMAAAKKLRAAGWVIFNPAEMDIQEDDGGPDLNLSIEQQRNHAGDFVNSRKYARRDLHVLTDLLRAEWGDAIFMLPDWEESIGANAEIRVARWVGLEVIQLNDRYERKYGGGTVSGKAS